MSALKSLAVIYAHKPKIDSRLLKMGSAASSLSRVKPTKSNDARSRIELFFCGVDDVPHRRFVAELLDAPPWVAS
jgi:hypothetical protein